MPDALPALTKDELFARLAEGHAGEVTVVTPNRRLAQALQAEFDHRQVAADRTVWESADILPYPAFVERLYDDALYSELGGRLPILLTPDQEQSLWEEVVRRSPAGGGLLAVPETAARAAEAWALAHAWRLLDELGRAPLDDDSAAFADWARAYGARTSRDRATDRARLPAVVAGVLGNPLVKRPKRLVAYGFDVVTPQQRALLKDLAASGVQLATCSPVRRTGAAVRVAALDARDEMLKAARWARARLEANGHARIGIVVPDLAARRNALRRVLAQTMDPGRTAAVLPFNVSLGDPLASRPLVAHALAALALGGREIEFERASALVRSPFIAGAESELQRRARLDARLRRRAEPLVRLDRLVEMADEAPALARTLAAYAEFRKRRLFAPRAPGDWARAFSEGLSLLGFPGERALDSTEYQTLKKWHEVVARFACLDRVAGTLRFDEALARLGRMAAESLFQPESPVVPVQVLGLIEAAGMTFDHLWVMGLSDEAWPAPAHLNPFIPVRLQRAAGVPNASPAAALERARELTAEWLGCAGEVVLSYRRRDGERDLAPSPLIASAGEGDLTLPEYPTWRDAIHRAANVERFDDYRAPALPLAAAAHGGVSLIKDQAACPFRAFAAHRLRAEGIGAPHTGLDAVERGTLVHRVLASAWERLGTKDALGAIDGAALEALLAAAADDAIGRKKRDRPTTLSGRFAAIERDRLVRLAGEWLKLERGRSGFSVLATEGQREAGLGVLKLSLRLDRVDQLASGERVVIDYKTGRAAVPSMLGERPDEPQLPLYLTVAEQDAAAVAFAQVRAGDMKFVGLAREAGLVPGTKAPVAGWEAQRTAWRAELERLAGEFAAGIAAVDPKRLEHTCRLCDLHSLCRIHERTARASEGGE
jgi:probable DNA repair protein